MGGEEVMERGVEEKPKGEVAKWIDNLADCIQNLEKEVTQLHSGLEPILNNTGKETVEVANKEKAPEIHLCIVAESLRQQVNAVKNLFEIIHNLKRDNQV